MAHGLVEVSVFLEVLSIFAGYSLQAPVPFPFSGACKETQGHVSQPFCGQAWDACTGKSTQELFRV
jgi:hypothetical protein